MSLSEIEFKWTQSLPKGVLVEPGQTYERAGVVVLVLRKRTGPPDSWGNLTLDVVRKQTGDWYDVLNLASEVNIMPFHEEGRVVAWHESLFHPKRCKRMW